MLEGELGDSGAGRHLVEQAVARFGRLDVVVSNAGFADRRPVGELDRASWDAAVGKVARGPFSDNRKAWSGDHCVDPHLVPGVLFCNRAVALENPGIEDMAPTALDLFGIKPPPYMEGKALFRVRQSEKEEEVAA